MPQKFNKDLMYYKFCAYGFLKNLNFFKPFLLLFFIEKGFSFLEIGILYGVQSIAVNILEIPTGILADSAGRRRTMVYSMVSYLVAFPVFFFSRSFSFFIVAMICMAFGDAFRTGTHKAMIFQYLKLQHWEDQKVYYYGHTRSWSQLGSALAALIAALIVFFSGVYRYIFLASMIPYILDLLLLLSYPKELDGTRREFSLDRLKENTVETVREFIRAIRDPRIIRAIVNSSSYSAYFDALKDYLQPVLKSFALTLPFFAMLFPGTDETRRSALVVGIMYLVINVLTAFASRYSGRFAERFNAIHIPMNVSLLAGLAFGIASGLAFNALWIPLTVVLFIVLYLVQNLRRPMGEAYITETLSHDILAVALSAESQVKSLLTALIAPLLGFFADQWGVGIALSLVSALLLGLFPIYSARTLSLKQE